MKKGINGRNKGNDFERRVAKILSDWWGLTFRRVPMSGGYDKKLVVGDLWIADRNATIEDVKTFPFCIEAKNRESWEWTGLFNPDGNKELFNYYEQAKYDAANQNKHPIMIFKKNLTPIYIMWDETLGLYDPYLPRTTMYKQGMEQFSVAILENWLRFFTKYRILSITANSGLKTITRSPIVWNQF